MKITINLGRLSSVSRAQTVYVGERPDGQSFRGTFGEASQFAWCCDGRVYEVRGSSTVLIGVYTNIAPNGMRIRGWVLKPTKAGRGIFEPHFEEWR